MNCNGNIFIRKLADCLAMANSGIKAADIMTKEVVIAHPDMTIVEAAKLMNRFRIGGLPVLKDGKLHGIVTERDIMRAVVEPNKLPSAVTVKEIMTSPPNICGREDEDMNSIVQKMASYNVTRIPIVDESNRLRGIVTNKDVLKSSSEFIDVLLEQAKIKGVREDYTAFGKCELCGESAHLLFHKGKFVCDNCIKALK